MTDDWTFWQAALDNPKDVGRGNLAYVDDPQTGYYRIRFGKDQKWEPVSFFHHEGRMVGMISGKMMKNPGALWSSACRNPITITAYEKANMGEGWDDDDPTVASMIGHNVGSDIDALRDQIEAAKVGAEAYATIDSDEQAGKAQSLRARMNELAGTADKKREELKKPHFEAGKAIDKEWMPLVKDAKATADFLRANIAAFETMKLRERQHREAERRRAEQELNTGGETAPPPPPPETTLKGNYGRAASIGVKRTVIAITDQDALYQHLRNDAFLHACLLDLAKREVKAGREVPGVLVEEVADIR